MGILNEKYTKERNDVDGYEGDKNNQSYLKIAEHYNNCFQIHGDTHLGVDWPNHQDTLKRHETMYGVIREKGIGGIANSSILDFGCGAGHFYEWLLANKDFPPIYSGLDINQSFIDLCNYKFPQNQFYRMDILNPDIEPISLMSFEQLGKFDYIIADGVFTEKRELTWNQMFYDFFTPTIFKLWTKVNKGLAFNVMSTNISKDRTNLFAVSLDQIQQLCKDVLFCDFVIKADYLPYEYTVYCYKK